MKSWRVYERFVAKLITNQNDSEITVVPNARLVGSITGVKRQIDVLLDYRYGDKIEKRVIVDAKHHKRQIDVKQVEAFEGMMKDVRASRGILVCPHGHTKAALKRAQDAITIQLVPLSALESLDLMSWDACANPKCKKGFVLWDTTPGFSLPNGLLTIFATSKCDECHRFNIWCWDCGERFALGDEDEHHCNCKSYWFWLTAIEDDSEDKAERLNAVYLLLVFADGQHFVVDRRPLR